MKRVFMLLIIMLFGFDLVGCNSKKEDYEGNFMEKPNIETDEKTNYFNTQFMPIIKEKSKDVVMNDETIINEIVDRKDIEKIIINLNIYSSIKLYIEQKEEIELIINVLNSDKKQIFNDVKFSFNDVNYFVDIIYKEKVVSIKILSNDDIYYFIDDSIYICTESNHELLANFITQKYIENIPETNFLYGQETS